MTMTLEEALAFKLPNGKTLGTATVEELKAAAGHGARIDVGARMRSMWR